MHNFSDPFWQITTSEGLALDREKLRDCVAKILSCSLNDVVITHQNGFAPLLVKPRLEHKLYLSKAVRGPFLALAASTTPIGIDVEIVSGHDIPWNVLHPQEQEVLKALQLDRRAEHFAILWALKEAYLKMRGTGLSRAPESFYIHVEAKIVSYFDPLHREKPQATYQILEQYGVRAVIALVKQQGEAPLPHLAA
jgi:phosphopantetheine--protein transferase-like protein